MPARTHRSRQHFSYKRVLIVVIGLIFLYILLPQLHTFHDSLEMVRKADVRWLVVALLAIGATSFLATVTYQLLAKRHLRPGRTLLIQLASLFTNRLLPAGIGTIGLNYEYLRRNHHQPAEAGAVVATNNLVGFLGHLLLLAVVLLVGRGAFHAMRWPHISSGIYWALVGLLLVAAAISARTKFRRMVVQAFAHILASMGRYRAHPLRLAGALLNSMALTACYALALYACVCAVGLHLAPADVFIAMTLGVAGATVTPTPGGLGGAEAGLLAGLVLYGVPSSDALAAVLLYRFFSYWLALVAGVFAFIFATRREYV